MLLFILFPHHRPHRSTLKTLEIPPKKEEEEKEGRKEKKRPNLCCLYIHWSMVKLSVVSPFPTCTPAENHWLCRVTLQHPFHNFSELSSMAFLSRMLLWGSGEGLSQKPSVSLFLNCEPAIINTMAKVTSLLFYSQQECRSWTYKWSLASAYAMDLHVVSGGSTKHGHQLCLCTGQRHHHSLQDNTGQEH